jgi:hypothetical protein
MCHVISHNVSQSNATNIPCHLCAAAPRPASLAEFSSGPGHGAGHRRSYEASHRPGGRGRNIAGCEWQKNIPYTCTIRYEICVYIHIYIYVCVRLCVFVCV